MKGLPRSRSATLGESGDLKLRSYTKTALPSAAKNKGVLVNCTNGNAGANCLAWSDGTNWKVVALGATVS